MNQPPNWESSREELAQIVASCRSLSARVRTLSALTKCLYPEFGFFAPAQRAAERLDLAAETLGEFTGPTAEKGPVAACVNRLIKGLGRGNEKRSPAPRGRAHEAGEVRGHSRAISVPEMLELLSLAGKTGVLQVSTQLESFTLELERGEVVHASSTGSPKGERLGEVLIAQGVISEKQLREFLTGCHSGEKLGQALAAEKVISKAALARGLSHQIQQVFTRLFASEEAYFIFREGTPANDDAGLRMNITGLLLESATSLDERQNNERQNNERQNDERERPPVPADPLPGAG